MAKAKNEKALQAEKLYKSGLKLVDVATRLSVPPGTVRRWKNVYDWDGEKPTNASKNVRSEANETPPEIEHITENPDLTDKERLFCIYYARSFNATRSYLKAFGGPYESARTLGPRIMKKKAVRAEIMNIKRERCTRALLEPGDIFQKYMEIAFSDITDYLSFGRENKPVMTMYGPLIEKDPETGEKRTVTQEVNSVRLNDSAMVDGSIISEVSEGRDGVKVKLADRMRALEWLANHIDLATDEQRARLENLKANTAKIRGDGDDGATENDGFLDALKGKAADVWQKD